MTKIVIDLGCGYKKHEGAIGVDYSVNSNADVIHDLNIFPYPFGESDVDVAIMDNSLEHLNDIVRVTDEVFRITKDAGLVKVIVPYFRSRWAFIDPTHKHFFTVDSFSYYDPSHFNHSQYPLSKSTFRVERVVFNEGLDNSFIRKLFVVLGNWRPGAYEKWISHFYPLDQLTFYLRVLKM